MYMQRQSDTETQTGRERHKCRDVECERGRQRRDMGMKVKGSYLEMDRQGARDGKR